jgi:sterol desaturase/sphingolipid hydroxylase (fatty acid hydroxylase superfamily)
MIERVLAALLDPLRALAEPEKRVFWPHLLASALIVTVLWARGSRRRSLARALFDPSLWLHRSARLDYALFAVKGLLRVTLFAPFALAAVPLAARVSATFARSFGESPLARTGHGPAVLVFSALLFVVEDLSRFLFHLATHRVAPLWELHKVHHSAEVLTPFTLYRVHPIEGLLNRTRGTLTTALVAGVCAWAFPGHVRALEILGVDALGFLWSFAGANLRHSHVWISYGPRVERWLLSPAQHQVHHGLEAEHHDRNFGTALALWDRLFGTLYVPEGREHVRVGLSASERAHGEGLVGALVVPVLAAMHSLLPRQARSVSSFEGSSSEARSRAAATRVHSDPCPSVR